MNKKTLLILLIAAVGIFFGLQGQGKPQIAYADTDCGPAREINPYGAAEWDEGGYHYIIWRIGAQASGDPTVEDRDTSEYFDSTAIGGTCGNDDFTWDGGDFRWVGGGDVEPIGAELGVPSSRGDWANGGLSAGLRPDTPGVFADSFGRPAAAVDDGGRIRIIGTGSRTVLCVGLSDFRNPDCGPDIMTYTSGSQDRNGAGFLFTSENCPAETVDSTGKPHNCSNSEFDWYREDGSGTDLTNVIGRDSDGTLGQFRLSVQARNTKAQGFSASIFVTMRYPGNSGYQHRATLELCPNQDTQIEPGERVCLIPGMENNSRTTNGPLTYVQLEPENYTRSQALAYLSASGSQPTCSDPAAGGRGYDPNGVLANGVAKPHYWWRRNYTPYEGRSAWKIECQSTYVQTAANTPNGDLCFRTMVSPANSTTTYTTSARVCVGVGRPVVDPAECPLPQPSQSAFPLVNVTLPDQSPSAPFAPTDSFPFTLVRDDTYYQDVRQRRTEVRDINDISSGGLADVEPTLVDDSTYQRATLNYSPYVREYPFDQSQSSVTYRSYYDRTTWRSAASPSGYFCDSGYSLVGNGPTCENYYPAERYYTCTGRWSGPVLTGYGYLCYDDVSHSAIRTTTTRRVGNRNVTTTTYSCSHSNDSLSGQTCTHRDWSVANGPYYRCPNGGSVFNGGGYGMLCRRTRQGTPFYNWRNAGTQRNQYTTSTVNAYQMGPCYHRTYDASPTAGTASLTPDYENPSQASFNGRVDVDFNTPVNAGRNAMRRASRVDLPYTISYYVQRANGSGTGMTDINNAATIVGDSTLRNSDGDQGVGYSFGVSVPGVLQVGDRVCWILTTTRRTGNSQTNGLVNLNGAIQSGNGRNSDEQCSGPVVNQPYLRVYGGDVIAGSGFGVGCSVNNNAGIFGWNRGNGAGSSTQFAAQAAGTIEGVSSATGRGSTPTPPRGLSFGNQSGTYGGNFGSGGCARDYFAFADADDIQTSYPNSAATLTVPRGARQVVYIDGDAFVRRNVVFDGAGGWANLNEIPSYYLVVRGNIYISENVTQLDGVYVAQPRNDGSGGRIYTCADHGTRTVRTTSPAAFDRCATKLTINGAFLANEVRFLRTNGSLRDSSPGEQSTSGTIAEVFNYSPELFLVDPGLSPAPARQYDSASGLPPVL